MRKYQLKKLIRIDNQLKKTQKGRVKLQRKRKEYRLHYKKVSEAREKAFQNPLVSQDL